MRLALAILCWVSFQLGWVSCADPTRALVDHVVGATPSGEIEKALQSFIGYSEQKRLGMHLGEEKGLQIMAAVEDGLPDSGPAAVLEVGCHAGDGTLSIFSALKGRPGSTIVSTEGNKAWLDGARSLVGHATKGMDLTWLPLEFQEQSDFAEFLDNVALQHGIVSFDTIIFDHDEKLFLPHLKLILAKGMLKKRGTVMIDNVDRKARMLRNYMDFVKSEKSGFVTDIRYVKSPYKDAIAISKFVVGSEL